MSEGVRSEVCHEGTEASIEIVAEEDAVDTPAETGTEAQGVVSTRQQWTEMVASSFGQFRQVDDMLRYPWQRSAILCLNVPGLQNSGKPSWRNPQEVCKNN